MSVVSVLPDDVLAAVLGRLRPRSLAASRRVCRLWRAVIDERRLLHARWVHGLFVNYDYWTPPRFFSRPTTSSNDGHRIDGRFDYMPPEEEYRSLYEVIDHCNGLVLYRDVVDSAMCVCNPAMRRSGVRLPQRAAPGDPLRQWHRALLAFDPAVSPHFTVFLERPVNRWLKMEWPPSHWVWREFSSRTGAWEEKVFIRGGKATGTAEDLLWSLGWLGVEPPWRYAAYWQGSLYVHCHGEYVSRLSLLNGAYQVIKSPIELVECMKDVRSYLGRSKHGVYFAAIDGMHKLRVWALDDSTEQTRWLLKYQNNLRTESWWSQQHKYKEIEYEGPWILLDADYTRRRQWQNVFWDSDDDNVIDVLDDDDKEHHCGRVQFLGFHPYKEVIFLCQVGYIAVACHLNTSKVQYLGTIRSGGFKGAIRESFIYTPCFI